MVSVIASNFGFVVCRGAVVGRCGTVHSVILVIIGDGDPVVSGLVVE